MKYAYDPQTGILSWEDSEPEPSPVPGVSLEDYRDILDCIRRVRRMSPIEVVEENQDRIELFRDMRPIR